MTPQTLISDLIARGEVRERDAVRVLKKLEGLPLGAQLQLLLNPRGSLAWKAPVEALQAGRTKDVLAAAEGFAE